LKITSDYFLESLKANFDKINIIFLYGNNLGLVELLYKKTLDVLKININDPFSVSKIDGEQFKDRSWELLDSINTLSMFSEKRFILLDLMHIFITKSIENIILKALETEGNNYLLLIKCGNIKQSAFTKHFQNNKNSIIVPCYEEKLKTIYNEISNLFSKHKLYFEDDFINNLTVKFNSDSLNNKMEIEKLDSFLTNNKNVTKDMIFELISSNEDVNFNKVVEYCVNGNVSDSLNYFERIYDNQNSSITLIKMFVSHFKLIEKILLLAQNNKNLINVIENIRPPIFFKKKEFVIFQCKVWNLRLINIVLNRLINLEIKCKLNNLMEKTIISQFILSTSVIVKNRIKS
tara:strand:- start:245 stop:1285 length:1041 start_codon:yes stop_codon:yes gene_type:complete